MQIGSHLYPRYYPEFLAFSTAAGSDEYPYFKISQQEAKLRYKLFKSDKPVEPSL